MIIIIIAIIIITLIVILEEHHGTVGLNYHIGLFWDTSFCCGREGKNTSVYHLVCAIIYLWKDLSLLLLSCKSICMALCYFYSKLTWGRDSGSDQFVQRILRWLCSITSYKKNVTAFFSSRNLREGWLSKGAKVIRLDQFCISSGRAVVGSGRGGE